MKIAIIGASGFVGTRLHESLVLEGRHDVRALLRSPGSLARLARFPLGDWCITDALDADALTRDLEGCDVMVHSMVGTYDDIPAAAHAAAEACGRRGIRLVYLSTASVHGQHPPKGTTERSPISAEQPLPYNVAKVRAELALAKAKGAEICVLRPSIVFGPRSQWTIGLARRLRAGTAYLVEGGQGICNSIYVDNLVQAIRICFDHPRACEVPFYVSDAEALTWQEFYKPLVEGLGYTMEDVHDVPRVGPPRPTLQDRVRFVRRIGLARETLKRVPKRFKEAAFAGLTRYASGGPRSEFALVHEARPVADYETSELHTCETHLLMAFAHEALGFEPEVRVHEGLRRSAEFLRLSYAEVPVRTI